MFGNKWYRDEKVTSFPEDLRILREKTVLNRNALQCEENGVK
jgi:hypothetical protein